MNSLLADLRKEREEREKKDGVTEPSSRGAESSEATGSRRRKQSAPRRIIKNSDSAPVVAASPNQSQTKRTKPDSGLKQNTDTIDLTDSEPTQKKPRKPKAKTSTEKKPRTVSSVEFESDHGVFDPQEMASELI